MNFSSLLATVSGKSSNADLPLSGSSGSSRSSRNLGSSEGPGKSTSSSKPSSNSRKTALVHLDEKDRTEQEEKVRRLKAARIEEMARKNPAALHKSTKQKVKNFSSGIRKPPVLSSKAGQKIVSDQREQYIQRPQPKKKLRFSEIMKQAKDIDPDKLKMTVKMAPRRPSVSNTQRKKAESVSESTQVSVTKFQTPGAKLERPSVGRPTQVSSDVVGKPMPKLLKRLEKQRELKSKGSRKYGYEEDEDDEDDDFIEHDEEVEGERSSGYDKDEIWKIFNRGKSRKDYERYDDHDCDDMEATESQILEEERRSALQAKLEDEREQRELERLEKLKKKRLTK